jgi:segregation and condensation protein B
MVSDVTSEGTGADAAEAPATGPAETPAVLEPPDAPAPDGEPSDSLVAVVEALIYASPEPLGVRQIARILDGEAADTIHAAIARLRAKYDVGGGLQLVEVAGGYQIVTRPELHEWVRRLFRERTTQKLSVQALETLAVIAYKQPITAAEIAEIRGVNTAGVLGTLLDRKLIKIAGRKPVVGRPFMYATTREFLDRFGLRDLSELPKVEDMADVLGFEPPALDTRPGLPFDAPADETGGEPRATGMPPADPPGTPPAE